MTFNEVMMAGLSWAVCDLLVKERLKTSMLVKLLEEKGVLTEGELLETFQKMTGSGLHPSPIAEETLSELKKEMQQRWEARLEEIRFANQNPQGPTQ